MKPIEHLQKRFIAEQAKLLGWIETDIALSNSCYNERVLEIKKRLSGALVNASL